MTGKTAPFGFHAFLQIGHLFIAALFKAGKHILKAAAFVFPACLPFVIAGPVGAGTGAGTVKPARTAAGTRRRRRRTLRRFHCLFHGKAYLSIVADA